MKMWMNSVNDEFWKQTGVFSIRSCTRCVTAFEFLCDREMGYVFLYTAGYFIKVTIQVRVITRIITALQLKNIC